ncbi:MAG: hypothetical protein Q8S21_06695 [Candidatus Paracaedibacteraceae bacterium]|nr:hypothetical protein [Candidatus Paracaedibacteraceae bacterium]
MLSYRANIMLYSSVLALCLLDVSKGFADSSTESQKDSYKVKKLDKNAKEDTTEAKKDVKLDGTPPSADDEKRLREKEQEVIKLEERKKSFLKRIEAVTNKNSAGLQFVLGKEIDVQSKIQEKNEKIIRGLNISTQNNEYLSLLSKKIERMYNFISSKKQSIADDAEWFKHVYDNAKEQLSQLKELRAKFKKIEHNNEEKKSLESLYNEVIESFLASYGVMAVTEAYLVKGADYCKNKEISGHFMQHFFPHFSDEAFKASAASIDMVAGDQRRALTTAFDSHLFYPIDEKVSNEHLASDAPKDSDDAKLMAKIKEKLKSDPSENKDIKKLMDPKNGGIITSYNIMLRDGMSAPLCVYAAVSCNTNSNGDIKEYTTRRFSIVEKQNDTDSSDLRKQSTDSGDLTKQLIDSEQKENRTEIENADAKLREELRADAEKERLEKEQEAANLEKENLEKLKEKADDEKSKKPSEKKDTHSDSEKDKADVDAAEIESNKDNSHPSEHDSPADGKASGRTNSAKADSKKTDDSKPKHDTSKNHRNDPATEKSDKAAPSHAAEATSSGSTGTPEKSSESASTTDKKDEKSVTETKQDERPAEDKKGNKPAEKGFFKSLFAGKPAGS